MARKSRKNVIQTMSEPVYKAALYSRISVETEEKLEADTIGNQVELLKRYVNEQEDIIVYQTYIDDDITGTNFQRPAFQRMMQDVKEGKVNCIIVKDLSRFGRNFLETGEYVEKILPLYQIRFIAITDNFDSIRNGYDLSIPARNLINDLYAKDISVKICTSMRMYQRAGKYIGSKAPYGYRKSDNDKHAFVIDPVAAQTVRTIFEMTAEGSTFHEIRKYLIEQGIPSPGRYAYEKGEVVHDRYRNSQWYTETISKIVRNPVYTGCMVSGKYRSEFVDGGNKQTAVPKEEWIYVEDQHEPIVTRELFERVQKVNEKKKQRFKASYGIHDNLGKEENILKSKLVCGECGKSICLVRKKTKNGLNYYYSCYRHEHYGNSVCGQKGIPKAELENTVLEVLKNQMRLFLDVQKAVSAKRESSKSEKIRKCVEREIRNCERQAEKYRQSKTVLYEDYASGCLSTEQFQNMNQSYSRQMDEVLLKIKELNETLALYSGNSPVKKDMLEKIQQYNRKRKLTREMAEALVDRIVIYDKHNMEIKLNFQDEYEKALYLWGTGKKEDEEIAG